MNTGLPLWPAGIPAALQTRQSGTPVGAMTVIEPAQAAVVTPHVVRHYTRTGLLLPHLDRGIKTGRSFKVDIFLDL
ncbi:MAG: hypothetical protein U9P00_14455 [Pseudomonadota bacterium]|nr:hypothetical protein [Pseudomonadota bacterium]